METFTSAIRRLKPCELWNLRSTRFVEWADVDHLVEQAPTLRDLRRTVDQTGTPTSQLADLNGDITATVTNAGTLTYQDAAPNIRLAGVPVVRGIFRRHVTAIPPAA